MEASQPPSQPNTRSPAPSSVRRLSTAYTNRSSALPPSARRYRGELGDKVDKTHFRQKTDFSAYAAACNMAGAGQKR